MRVPAAERGFLLIVAVIVIAVGGAMAVVILTLTGGSSGAGINHLQSTQALFIAESGLEKAIRQRSLSNTYVGEGPTPMGQGNYTISVFDTDFGGAPLPSGQRRLRSVGSMDAATRTVEAIVRTAGAMMAYAKESPAASVGIPFIRQWDNDTYAWGAEGQAIDVGPNIIYMILKFARTRNEAILGTMNTAGQIHVQIWNGATWGDGITPGNLRLITTIAAPNNVYRGFDIEYESLSDRAVIVFNNANNRNPGFQIWDGASWTATVGLNVGLGGNYSSSNNAPRWIELAPHPRADDIGLITLDAAAQAYGVRWDGATWSRMSAATIWDTAAASATSKVIDAAYEQQSGDAMFIWGDDTNGNQNYRTWDGTTLSGNLVLNLGNIPGPDMTGRAVWLKIVPNYDAASTQLLYAVQDDQRDLFTAFWDGAAWGAETRLDNNLEDSGDRNFDIVFETHPNNVGLAWIVWGTRAGADFTVALQWNGAAWAGGLAVLGQEAAFTRVEAHPASGAIFALVYEDSSSPTDDIAEYHLTGGGAAWATSPVIWAGPVVGNPVRQRIALAVERRTPTITRREVFP